MNSGLRTSPVKLLLRIARIAVYPLLGVSLLLFAGLSFGTAFLADFTIQNNTDETIVATPIGTVGKRGHRYPLPICSSSFLSIHASQRGGFRILPGESIEIVYDMDDINFSEIVVDDRNGERGQIVVNPNPTQNQYHAPVQRQFVVDDLDSLDVVPQSNRNAARAAQVPTQAPWIIFGVLLGPWIALLLLAALDRSLDKSNSKRESVVDEAQS